MTSPAELPLGPLMVDLGGETLTTHESDFLRHPAVGAVILFDRNYRNKAQVRTLTEAIKALRSPALLVAVDQEGGRVQRFREGFHRLPAAARIGELYDRDRAHGIAVAQAVGELMAREVREVGVDFSFAPVLDCQPPRSRPRNHVIGARAFHHNPAIICELADAYITGMNRAGMSATGKHFPGHGGVSADSHQQTPVDTRTFAEIEAHDLLPFAGLANRLGGIMTAHVLFERIHEQLPTYALFWLKGILRKKLNFDGVIFSDDLSMKGADTEGDIPSRCVAALTAGCDMTLICNDPDGARRAAEHLADDYPCNQTRLLSMIEKVNTQPDPVMLAQLANELASTLRQYSPT